ncbi:MAG: hypothetical protein NT120_04340 [Candidatus Aenigmarchaeota archaeon]|nr:hypothetical protein [Candidatus Aenigmarchaeota archaeon]
MKKKDAFWAEGSFAQSMGPNDAKKMRTFHMKHDEEMNFSCKKCKNKISVHNNDWHDGMCDDCFNRTHFPEDQDAYEKRRKKQTKNN